jgi:hypothetical protein
VENMPLEKIIEIGTQVGVKTALETLKKERDEKRKSRYDRRLRNTRLLLREYRKLMIHREESVKSNKRAIDSLDELEDECFTSSLYIESISQSKERTAIIISHIDKMLEIFKALRVSRGRGNVVRLSPVPLS